MKNYRVRRTSDGHSLRVSARLSVFLPFWASSIGKDGSRTYPFLHTPPEQLRALAKKVLARANEKENENE